MKTSAPQPYRKTVLNLMSMSLFVKGLQFLVPLGIARFCESGAQTDLYFYFSALAVCLTSFFEVATLSVILPEGARLSASGRAADGARMIGGVFGGYFLFAAAFGAWIALFPDTSLAWISRFSPEAIGRSHFEIRFLAVNLPLFVVSSSLGNVLGFYGEFVTQILLGGLGFAGALVGIAGAGAGRITALAVGQGIGLILATIWSLRALRRRHGFRLLFSRKALLSHPRSFWADLSFAVFGQGAAVFAEFAVNFALSGLAAGALSSLNYARQLLGAVTAIAFTQFSYLFGLVAIRAAASNWEGMGLLFRKHYRPLLLLASASAGGFWIGAQPLVELLYRGGRLSVEGRAEVVFFLRILGLSLPFMSVTGLSGRLFSAARKVRVWTCYQFLSQVILLAGLWFLMPALGTHAYPVAVLIQQPICFGMLLLCFSALPVNPGRELARSLALNILVCGVLTALALGGAEKAAQGPLWVAPCALTFFILLVLLSNHWLKLSPELGLQVPTRKTLRAGE